MANDLQKNIDKIHTTEMGRERIKQNLVLKADINAVDWCKQKITQSNDIVRTGKNWYVSTIDCVITVNVYSYTIITAHKRK
ncbi:MAG: DUF3781 domain-containing protein [Endomicrobium sp.]|nr:DUF3781 domain-containing protein [Endomicrobium sp.]